MNLLFGVIVILSLDIPGYVVQAQSCLGGASMYLIPGTQSPLACIPMPGADACPLNHECSPSNADGVFVCCTTTILSNGSTSVQTADPVDAGRLTTVCKNITSNRCPPCPDPFQQLPFDGPKCQHDQMPYVQQGSSNAHMCHPGKHFECPPSYTCVKLKPADGTSPAEGMCCPTNLGLCPPNIPPFVPVYSSVAMSCSLSVPSSCPNGYVCVVSTMNHAVCCPLNIGGNRHMLLQADRIN